LDFVSDQLTDGRRFRIMTVVDECTQECLALIADTSRSGARVAREPAMLFDARGKPQTIVSDNDLSACRTFRGVEASLQAFSDSRLRWR
jgi:putative transposase